MSNQLVITSGAKVRNLNGVLTGTSGVVNSVPYGGPNGVATLDSLGKVPLSQLPASVVTYLGTWNAATNTPTLANGTGDVGDLYICNVAGTVNFGAGPITFAVGDWVIYNGSQWQKSAGQNGTVTSVAVTESGDALTITGSPITTAGTINIGFAGTGSQYIKGDGTLATFPTIISQAQNLVTEVYNSTGSTLTKGTVVYINGGQGNLPTVTKAQANSEANSAQTYGLVQTDITNNNNGYVVVAGRLENLDTQAFSNGTTLYLSPSVAGGYTSTKPTSPDHIVYIGVIVRSHPTQGVIEVKIQNTQELNESADVLITSPANNEGLFYESATSLWKNKTIANVLGYTPANASLVVPYTGATANVNLGSYNLTTNSLTVSNESYFDNALAIKKTGYTLPFTLTNKVYVYAPASGTGLTIMDGASPYSSTFTFSPTADRTYNLPDADGTIALTSNIPSLSGYVPYTGATTNVNLGTNILTANQLWTSGTSNSGLFMNQSSAISAPEDSSTYTSIKAYTNRYLYFSFGQTAAYKRFRFDVNGLTDNTTLTYTMPNASGTLALTSDIPSLTNYVTLNGNQTITGIKTFTNEQLFGNGLTMTGGYITYTSGSFNLTLNTNILTANRNVFLKDGSGTLAFTSDIPTISGTAPISYSGGVISITQANSTTNGFLSSTDWNTFNNKQNALTNPVTGTGTTNTHAKFTGTSTIGNSMLSDDGTTLISSGATRSNFYLRAASSSHYGQIAFTNGSNGNFGGISYNNSGQWMQFETNSSEWMRLSNDGKLGIGTTSPSDKLNVVVGSNGNNTRFDGPTSGLIIQTNASTTDIISYGGTTPAYRNLNFSASASTNMTIATDGRIGINTALSAWETGILRSIEIGQAGNFYAGFNGGSAIYMGTSTYYNNGWKYAVTGSAANLIDVGSGNFIFANAASGTAGNAISFNERMRITSSGNVGIGTSSPSARLTINANSSSSSDATYLALINPSGENVGHIDFNNTFGNLARITGTKEGGGGLANDGILAFSTAVNSSLIERMRIVSDGSVTFGKSDTSLFTNGFFVYSTTIGNGQTFNSIPNAANTYHLWDTTNNVWRFYVGGNGTIYATNTSISSLSDARLKENIKDLDIGLDAIMALRPRKFDWTKESGNEGKNVRGFIAQEVEEIFPDLIDECKTNPMDEDSIKYKSLRQDFIPILVKAIQELKAEIDELKNK